MNKRIIFLILTAVVMAVIYVFCFTDWTESKKIQIFYRTLPSGIVRGKKSAAIAFFLDKPYKLTSIKVVSAVEARTNKYPHTLWHLIAATNSELTSDFVYGAAIPGMKTDIPDARPEPLSADGAYAIIVEAGKKLKGETMFTAGAAAATSN